MLTASDIMTDEIRIVYKDMLIRQAAHLMLRERITGLPVVDEKVGLIGLITITDLFMIINRSFIKTPDLDFHKRLAMFRDMRVEQVMTTKVVTVKTATTLDEIIDMVVHQNIHVFPVVEKKKLVGLVSRHDVLNAVFAYD